jgi:hypothetical protein
MKPAHLLVISLGLTLGLAFAEEETGAPKYTGTYVANGLTFTESDKGEISISGWYDANKTDDDDLDPNDDIPGADDNMCYAASAANLIAWWQNSKHAVSSPALDYSHAEIWDTFVRNNTIHDTGGDSLSAINWWISGVYAPVNSTGDSWAEKDDPAWSRYHAKYEDYVSADGSSSESLPMTLSNYQKDGAPFGGYYFDDYGLTQEDLSDFLVHVWGEEESEATHHTQTLGDSETGEDEGPDSISDIDFVQILKDSPMSLGLFSESDDEEGGLAHAVTLWGVEFDEEGNLVAMWLTDSDDYVEDPEPTLFSMSVVMNEADNRIYLGKWENGKYVGDFGSNVYIGGIYAMDTTTLENWQLVPEPATATLSLLALAGLAARRRRK